MRGPFPYLLVLFLIAALFHAEFLLYVVYTLFIAVLLARWWARRAVRGLTYARHFERHAFFDDHIPVQVELRNRGQLPISWLVVRELLPVELAGPLRVAHALSLRPGEGHTIVYELHGRRRGRYRLGPLRVGSGDLLGQEEYAATRPDDDYVTVYPRIVPLDRLGLPSLAPFGHLRTRERLYADPLRAVGLRDYAPGDNVRDIHWTASAAAATLQVKTYEPAMSLPTALLLDMDLSAYERWQGIVYTELGIVVAASLAVALGGARQEVALFTNGRDPLAAEGDAAGVGTGKGQGHTIRVLELLARLEAVNEAPHDVLQAARTRLPWGTTVVAIGPAGDEARQAALLSLRRAGFSVVRVVLGAGTRSGAIPTYHVTSLDDLDIWRQGKT